MKADSYSFDSGRFARWFAAAAAITAAMFALAWLSTSPAQAQDDRTSTTPGAPVAPELPDSDNLDFAGTGGQDYTASSFGIQYYTDRYQRGGTAACSGVSVFDGFAQTSATSGGRVEDFPVPDYSNSRTVSAGGANPCQVFVARQDSAVSQMAANGGYHLRKNSGGVLVLEHDSSAWYSRARVLPGTQVNHGGRVDSGIFEAPGSVGLVAYGKNLRISEIPFSIRVVTDQTGTSSGYRCPPGLHPRGEDSQSAGTDSSSGRTLSALTSVNTDTASEFWCRSDVRYRQGFTAPAGSGGGRIFFEALLETGVGDTHWDVPTGAFSMWGRKGCYYTVIEIDSSGDSDPVCDYPFPLSAGCAALTPARLAGWLGRTAEEMGDCATTPPTEPDCDPGVDPGCPPPARTCATNPDDPDLNCDNPIPPCVSNCGPPTTPTPPPTTPPCVAHTLAVAENVVAGSNATPGLTTASQYRTGSRWNLQTVTPYPNTAAPNRGTTDISGCPDGDETRLAHSNTARENAVYADSGTRPPPAADPTVDRYDPVRRNLSHQHAGQAAHLK